MKNQNDLILLIVAFLVLVGGFCGIYFTKPEPQTPPAPTQVNLAPLEVPGANVVMANSLPGGGGSNSPGGGGDMTSAGGPPPMGGGGSVPMAGTRPGGDMGSGPPGPMMGGTSSAGGGGVAGGVSMGPSAGR